MSEHTDPSDSAASGGWRSLLTPASCAIAAFAVALTSLMGSNLLVTGVQVLLGEGVQGRSDPATYFTTWGIGVVLPLVVVGLLARVPLRAAGAGWETHVARASLLLAGVTALGGVLVTVGGLLSSRH